jgi:hypothetical protein
MEYRTVLQYLRTNDLFFSVSFKFLVPAGPSICVCPRLLDVRLFPEGLFPEKSRKRIRSRSPFGCNRCGARC